MSRTFRYTGISLFSLLLLSPPACTPPPEPAQAAPVPPPGSLRFHPDQDGFVRFWLASPIQPLDTLSPTPISPDATWTPEVSAEPALDLLPKPPEDPETPPPTTQIGRWVTLDLVSNRPRKIEVTLGSDDGSSLWVAGKEIVSDPGEHAYKPGSKRAWLDLPAGTTPLSVRVEQGDGAWKVGVQLLSEIGLGAEDLEIRLPGVKSNDPRIVAELLENATLDTQVTLIEGGYRFDIQLTPFPGIEGNSGISAEHAGLPLTGPISITPAANQAATAKIQLVGSSENLRSVNITRPYYPEISRRVLVTEQFLAQARSQHPEHFVSERPETPDPNRIRLGYSTLEWLASRSRFLLEFGDKDPSYLGTLGAEIDWLRPALEANQDPFAGRTGAFWVAYRSQLDGQVQPFAIAIPSEWSKQRSWPMIIGLHGYKSEPGRFLREMIGVPLEKNQSDFAAEREFLQIPFPDPTAILVSALGRGDIAFRGPGEVDVLDVIALVKREWNVDPDRVHLTGVSMGGIGVFELASHRPDIFASATSLCGAADVRRFGSIAGKPVAWFEAPVLAAAAAVEWAENLTNLPFTCIHGTKDRTNSILNSAVMMDRLEKLGIAAVFEKPELGHDVQSDAWGGGKLWQAERPNRVKYPPHTVFVTRDLWYSEAYGVHIRQVANRLNQARVVLDRIPPRYVLQTENVTGLVLDVEPGITELQYGAQMLRLPPKSATLRIDPATQTATLAELPEFYRPQGPLGMMRPGPRLVVVPTGDPLSARLGQELAELWATPSGVKYTPAQIVRDTDFSWEQAKDKDLVLIGNPTNNSVWKSLDWNLPYSVSSAGISVSVLGEKLFSGPDVGLVAITRRPDDPSHALIVLGAINPWGLALARSLPRYLPDFMVFDKRIAGESGAILDGRETIGGGFFPG